MLTEKAVQCLLSLLPEDPCGYPDAGVQLYAAFKRLDYDRTGFLPPVAFHEGLQHILGGTCEDEEITTIIGHTEKSQNCFISYESFMMALYKEDEDQNARV